MSRAVEVVVGDLFECVNGRPKLIKDYINEHPGEHPVYSASLARPFGHIDRFDYDGRFLTWVLNGYGGRVQEVEGKFSVNRDRGVLVPKDGVTSPDLTYLRYVLEPQLVGAAVGRRVDGRRNEYTKIYPPTAETVSISLPATDGGDLDYELMALVGDRLRRVEAARERVSQAESSLGEAHFALDLSEPTVTLGLDDEDAFRLEIGQRVLRKDFVEAGVPAYSANALKPFGAVEETNLANFDQPSLLWGIDGVFDWNLIEAGTEFAITDHCGRLQILDERLDPGYIYSYLKSTRKRYGFDRVFRASLTNMRHEIQVVVPLGDDGEPSLERQRGLAADYRARATGQARSLAALSEMLTVRVSVSAMTAAILET